MYSNEQLTIIVPHYNSIGTLGKLLSSVYEETEDVVMVIVDDKSDKDNSDFSFLEKEYPKAKFLHNNTEKKGAGVCRNIGLNYLNTKWVMFADADDYFVSGWYDAVSKYFESDNEIVFFMPQGGRAQYYKDLVNYYFLSRKDGEYGLRINYNVPWAKLYKSEIIKANNYKFDEVMWANDIMFAIKTGISASHIDASPKELYYIGEVGDSLTKHVSEKALLVRAETNACRIRYLKDNLDSRIFNRFQGGNMLFQASVMYKNNGLRAAIKVYMIAKKYRVPFFPSLSCILYKIRQKKILSKQM